MSEVLVESDSFDASITVPSAGDLRTAASVKGAFQSLTNRTRRMLNHALTDAGGSRTLTADLVIAPGAGPYKTDFTCILRALGGFVASGGVAVDTFPATGGANFTTGGTVNFSVPITVGGGGSISSALTTSSVGRITRRDIDGADANSTYGINDSDFILVTPTGNRTYNLSATGAVRGDVIEVETTGVGSLTNTVVVKNVATTTMATLKSQTGFVYSARFRFNGTDWALLSGSPF